jgi:predicted DNA-binding protein (MmcQ/YjbR family)
MNIEEVREYCIAKKAVTESFPFDETTLVFKVMNKMFCLLSLDDFNVNLRNEAEKNVELRAHYPDIIPGYHMNKQLWNTINLNGMVPARLILELIDESYEIILKSLPGKVQEEYKNL